MGLGLHSNVKPRDRMSPQNPINRRSPISPKPPRQEGFQQRFGPGRSMGLSRSNILGGAGDLVSSL